jgi:hypothetical protein
MNNATKSMTTESTRFDDGFRKGLALWRDGLTTALISHKREEYAARGAEVFGNGIHAASVALEGWLDEARRAAKLAGLTSERAERLIDEAQRA